MFGGLDRSIFYLLSDPCRTMAQVVRRLLNGQRLFGQVRLKSRIRFWLVSLRHIGEYFNLVRALRGGTYRPVHLDAFRHCISGCLDWN